MDLIVWLLIGQGVVALLWRYAFRALFPIGAIPNPGNLPLILRSPLVLNGLVFGGVAASVAIVVCGFIFTDYPWWLTLFAIASFIWASPPYRNA